MATEKEHSKFATNIIIIVLIIVGGVLLYKYIKRENNSPNFSFSENNSGESEYTSSSEKYDPAVEFEKIPISNEIDQYIESSENVNRLELDEDLKFDIKRILSDPNPDPENISGEICEEYEKKCKWCSDVFYIYGKYSTVYSKVKNLIQPDDLTNAFFAAIEIAYGKDKLKKKLDAYRILYRLGEKYICDPPEKQEFCSERCKNEYQLYH